MISAIQPVSAGNALRVWLTPAVQPARIRILRKEADSFVGWDDPEAFVVADGPERVVTDYTGLINGVPVFYRAFYLVNGAWIASETRSGTPAASFSFVIVDPMIMVRDRLEQGLVGFVNSGAINHVRGYIPVMTATPQVEDAPWPLVTVHLANDAADIRGLGEEVAMDFFSDADGLWHSFEGTYGRTDLTIVVWSLNSDERIILRNAVKAILTANLPVFDAAGLLQVAWSFTDTEDFETYQAPVYQTVCSFNCHALTAVDNTDPPISDVSVTRND